MMLIIRDGTNLRFAIHPPVGLVGGWTVPVQCTGTMLHLHVLLAASLQGLPLGMPRVLQDMSGKQVTAAAGPMVEMKQQMKEDLCSGTCRQHWIFIMRLQHRRLWDRNFSAGY